MTTLSFAEKTKFSTLCKVLEQVKNAKRNEKAEIMHQFINAYHEQSKNHQNDNFYPIMRLLLPQLERERGSYGIKEHTLAKTYIRILNLAENGQDAQKLLSYRSSSADVSDFADVAFWIVNSRCPGTSSLTIYQVNSNLDNIASKHANREPRGVDAELKAMILNMAPLEQKWLIRILLKDLKLSLSSGKILALFHPDSNDLFDVSQDLFRVCTTLKNPSIRLNEIAITLFQPFKPMLSQRCDVQNVNKDIKKSESYYIEIKFDGERFQLHYQEQEFKYFSRNGHDYTNTYGCNSSLGILTPKLSKLLHPSVKSCILDGEMMCWNTWKKCFTTKGQNIDVKTLKMGHINQPCFCVFDILLLNDKVLTNKPLCDRFKTLEQIIIPEEGVFVISAKEIVTSGYEILNSLNQAIRNNNEGIIVKDPSSLYKPSARNAGWFKIKPEYTEGTMVELDLIVIGGYYGDGRRHGLISQFLLGVAHTRKDQDGKPCLFLSMGRVGSGYKDDELDELNTKLNKAWKKVIPNQMPYEILWTKERPDVWIKPSESFILQVKATEIIPSDCYKTGYTLRFPRIQKIRYDKPWYDCLTAVEFTNLRQAHCGKLTVEVACKLNDPSVKKTAKRPKKILTLSEECQSKKVRNVKAYSDLFNGKEICVLTGFEEYASKAELETKIVNHGGTVVQNPGPGTFCMVAGSYNIRVTYAMKSNKYDIVKPNWILDCIDSMSLKKLHPRDLVSMTTTTATQLSEVYDEYGDSFTQPITPEDLRRLIVSMNSMETVILTVKQMQALDKEIFETRSIFALFRGCYAYFHNSYENKYFKYEADDLMSMFRLNGGTESSLTDEDTTHVICFSRKKLPKFITTIAISKMLNVVHYSWMSESLSKCNLLNTSSYELWNYFDII